MNSDRFQSELEELKKKHLFRQPREFRENDGRTVLCNGTRYLLFCSNDYLGLSHRPELKVAMREGLERWGAGSGASRLVSGTATPHVALESALARYLRAGAVLLFGSGYTANVGVMPAVAGKGDVILADRLNHASLVDGCLLSRATFRRYPHLDMTALERLLKKHRDAQNRWIVTDGLFSMDGDLAPLDVICELAKRYDARVYLDDAHAFGVVGPNGRGSAALFGVEGKIDLVMGPLGKAAGTFGAFVHGSRTMVEYLVNRARSFIYSTALPPAMAHGATRAVELLENFDTERQVFLNSADAFRRRLTGFGLESPLPGYIIPLIVGTTESALNTAEMLWREGIYVQAIRPPTVPEGSSRLRVTLSLSHNEEDKTRLLRLIEQHRAIFMNAERNSHQQ